MIQSTQSGRSPVVTIVEAAAKRRLFTIMVEHAALALIAVCAAAIALLILGTDVLSWPWLLAIVLPGFLLGSVRVRRELLSRYAVAQLLDKRLRLGDLLSTAWFLLSHSGISSYPSLAGAQIERAEVSARGLECATAFPFVWRRNWAFAGALLAAMLGLFSARYLVTDSLSLKKSWLPLPALLLGRQTAQATDSPAEAHKSETAMGGRSRQEAERSRTAERRDTQPSPQRDQNIAAKAAGSQPSGSSQPPADPGKQSQLPGDSQKMAGMKPAGSGEPASPRPEKQPGDMRSPGSAQEQSEGRQNGENHSSLTEKMKDALSGLLDKMRPRESSPTKSGDERAQENPNTANQANANSENARTNANSANSSDQQKQGRDGSAQTKAAAQASERLSASAKGASDESSGHKGNDAHSGIGRQDGDKALKAAEQLRAMGKLEEIIGKRSATLTGDMAIETQSGHQQLQTQYTGRLGRHADFGGEIDRNEIPVALQNYVRDYMEQVRKQANGNQ